MKPGAIFGRKKKTPPDPPASTSTKSSSIRNRYKSIHVREKLSKSLTNKITTLKSAFKKNKRGQKNAQQMALVAEDFNDDEDEPLNEIKTLCYCIQEPRERTFADSVMEIFLGDVTASSGLKQFVIGAVVGW